jgi:hypothetical protein
MYFRYDVYTPYNDHFVHYLIAPTPDRVNEFSDSLLAAASNIVALEHPEVDIDEVRSNCTITVTELSRKEYNREVFNH